MNAVGNGNGEAPGTFLQGEDGIASPLPNKEAYGALYVHVPFCKQRCVYCDFETRAVPAGDPQMLTYAESVAMDIMRASHAGQLGGVRSIYLGGGTPTFLGTGPLTQILYSISLTVPDLSNVEWSVEANPDSVSAAVVRDMWALGVNRLSLGVQSFDDAELALLGRIHDARAAREAIACAQKRFENLSIDLICGIPGQTIDSFLDSLLEAVALGVKHISVYPLTVEEGTPLAGSIACGALPDVDDDFQATCMQLAAEVLHACGMQRYEVASYAYPGYECAHNMAYWTGVPYLGIGTGAVSMAQNDAYRVRTKNGKQIDRLTRAEALAEDLMLGMRMTAGIGPQLVDAALHAFPAAQETFCRLVDQGLAAWQDAHLVPTERGWLCGNEVYAQLLDLAM